MACGNFIICFMTIMCYFYVKITFQDRHQKGDTHPLDIDEVLEETNQTDLGARHKHWLTTEVSTEQYMSHYFALYWIG